MARLWRLVLASPLILTGLCCFQWGVAIEFSPHGSGSVVLAVLNCVSLAGLALIGVALLWAFRAGPSRPGDSHAGGGRGAGAG